MRLAATLLITYIGVPSIYYGDEVGLSGGNDPDCRRCFPWDTTDWDHVLHDHYRRLIQLRKQRPAPRRGDIQTLYAGPTAMCSPAPCKAIRWWWPATATPRSRAPSACPCGRPPAPPAASPTPSTATSSKWCRGGAAHHPRQLGQGAALQLSDVISPIKTGAAGPGFLCPQRACNGLVQTTSKPG